LRNGHGAFRSSWHNRTGTRTSHLSHEKTTNQTSANKTFTSETIDPAINQSKLRKLQRTSKNAITTAKTSTETCNLDTKLPLLHQNSRFTGQKHERTIKTSIHRLKLAQTPKNFTSLNKNSNERRKTSIRRTKLEQTVENLKLPIESLNER